VATDHRRAEVGCLLSHVRTLRTFLHDTDESVGAAMVFEDDVMFHREWRRRLEDVLENLPAEAPVCAIGYLNLIWADTDWAGIDPARRNLVAMAPEVMCGAHGYWVTREHARATVDRFDVEPGSKGRVSESLVWLPEGYAAWPPLVINDGTPSTIAGPEAGAAERQMALYAKWGIDRYLSVEGDQRFLADLVCREPQTICLCVVVHDDSLVIGRLADSVRGLIDTWVICDTGSTDGTPELVLDAFEGIPGQLFHDQWQDFGVNRTLMLERACGRADYLLILDADDIVWLEGPLPRLTAAAYSPLEICPPRVNETRTHWLPRLVRGDLPWRYVGSTHEHLECDQPRPIEVLPLLVIEHDEEGAARYLDRARQLLERRLEEDPDDPGAVFSLAETYREMGQNERAIELYARRIELGGWPEEMFCSMYWHAELVGRTDWALGVVLLLETWACSPTRAEPLFALTRGCRLRNQFRLGALFGARGKNLGPSAHTLFVPPDFCDWAIEYEWLICLVNLGDYPEALEAADHLLTLHTLPRPVREYVASARRCCVAGLGAGESTERLDPADLVRARTPPLVTLAPRAQIGGTLVLVDRPAGFEDLP
jgi:hypothetical protein